MSTIATDQIKRPPSPALSEISVYFDIDDNEVELSLQDSTVSTTAIETGVGSKSLVTQTSESPTSHKSDTNTDKAEELRTGDTQSRVLGGTFQTTTPLKNKPGYLISLPTTPDRLILSGQFTTPEASPSVDSQVWTDSYSDNEFQLQSPFTERSRSSSITSNYKLGFATDSIIKSITEPAAKSPIRQKPNREPCLQCSLAGLSLRCSFTLDPKKLSKKSKALLSTTRCRRCTSREECFCIRQVQVQKPEKKFSLFTCLDEPKDKKEEKLESTYHAEGESEEVVTMLAVQLLEVGKEERRFELPIQDERKGEGLKGLKLVWGQWRVSEEGS